MKTEKENINLKDYKPRNTNQGIQTKEIHTNKGNTYKQRKYIN